MHQDLVDDDLEEQRRDQREQLQEKGRDQDLREQLAVFDDCGNEPLETESGILVQQYRAAGQQNQFARPCLLENRPWQGQWTRLQGVLDQNLVTLDLRENEVMPVLMQGDCRQCGLGEALVAAGYLARLESQMPRRTQHVMRRKQLSGRRKPMPELIGISRQTEKA